ncbi:MAG: hypothetical protein ACJ0IB_08495 [Verrucomicrobiales bacterium]
MRFRFFSVIKDSFLVVLSPFTGDSVI